MATKTIDHMNFYVAIAGYQLPSVPDQTFNCLRVSVGYRKGSGFYASFHPGWGDGSMWGCMLDFSKDPLSAGMTVGVVPVEKNNAKRIAEMTESLKMAKDIIAALFDDREWQKLKGVLQNVARFGYTEKFKEQGETYLAARVGKRYEKAVKPIESETNNENNNQNSTTMTQNFKAADLIGKTIVVGDNQATIVIKSVDGDKLSGEFSKDGKTTPMSFPVSQLQGMTEKGLWKIQSGECRTESGEFATAATTDVTTEADVQEVQDIVPVVTPKAKSDGGSKTADAPSDIKPQTSNQPAVVKPIGEHGTLVVGGVPKPGEKSDKPKGKTQTSAVKPQTSYHVELLPTKDGQKWPKLYGFKDESEAKKTAGKMAKTVTYSWDRDEQGEKRYYLKGGKKYCEVFQQLTDALNIGEKAVIDKVCKASVAIFEGARSERTNTNRANDTNATPHSQGGNKPAKTEKTYTAAEVVDLIQRMAKKDPKALAEYEAMLQAA